jgi:hypothetical protein
MADLDLEYEYYESIKEELLKEHGGKFALIKGKELLGVFDTDYDAYKVGLEKCGDTPFLIVRIQRELEKRWIPALELGLLNASS